MSIQAIKEYPILIARSALVFTMIGVFTSALRVFIPLLSTYTLIKKRAMLLDIIRQGSYSARLLRLNQVVTEALRAFFNENVHFDLKSVLKGTLAISLIAAMSFKGLFLWSIPSVYAVYRSGSQEWVDAFRLLSTKVKGLVNTWIKKAVLGLGFITLAAFVSTSTLISTTLLISVSALGIGTFVRDVLQQPSEMVKKVILNMGKILGGAKGVQIAKTLFTKTVTHHHGFMATLMCGLGFATDCAKLSSWTLTPTRLEVILCATVGITVGLIAEKVADSLLQNFKQDVTFAVNATSEKANDAGLYTQALGQKLKQTLQAVGELCVQSRTGQLCMYALNKAKEAPPAIVSVLDSVGRWYCPAFARREPRISSEGTPLYGYLRNDVKSEPKYSERMPLYGYLPKR